MRSFVKNHDSSGSSLGTRSFLERPADSNGDNRAQKILTDIARPVRLPRDSPLFPSVLEPMHILRKWQYCREQVWSITRQELLSPQTIAAGRSLGGFPFLVKLFGSTRFFPIHEPGRPSEIWNPAHYSSMCYAKRPSLPRSGMRRYLVKTHLAC
jgi:hypothetical protein